MVEQRYYINIIFRNEKKEKTNKKDPLKGKSKSQINFIP